MVQCKFADTLNIYWKFADKLNVLGGAVPSPHPRMGTHLIIDTSKKFGLDLCTSTFFVSYIFSNTVYECVS